MTFSKKLLIGLTLALVTLAGALLVFIWWNFVAGRTDLAAPSSMLPAPGAVADGPAGGGGSSRNNEAPLAQAVVQGLEAPWALAFLPDGRLIFTERAGRIQLSDPRQGGGPRLLLTLEDVAQVGEGGLLGLALHPDFSARPFVYVYYTYGASASLANRVVRFTLKEGSLVDRKVLLEGIPGASTHDGGRLRFGPDRFLYITTGDAQQPTQAQDPGSLAGKILRLTDEGTVPPDNPFPGSPVYSVGHRNPQGLAWDRAGRLWATEHGQSATDEVNQIEKGKNYGWPTVRGDEKAAGLESPVIHSGSQTWAPSGAAIKDGMLYFAALRGQGLFAMNLQSRKEEAYLNRNFGRLRDVVLGPDNFLYILTNNRDGRGVSAAQDDQIIRINTAKLKE